MAEGLRNREIAEPGLSEATVKTHVRNVLKKLRFRNRAQKPRGVRRPLAPGRRSIERRPAVSRRRAVPSPTPRAAATSPTGQPAIRQRDRVALGARHRREGGRRRAADRAQHRLAHEVGRRASGGAARRTAVVTSSATP